MTIGSAFKGISVQLYSLRDESATDFDAVLAGVADAGFDAVEPFNLFGKTPAEFTSQVNALGLQISSSHLPWANRAPFAEVIDTLGGLGLRRAIGGFSPDDFKDDASLQATIETTNRLVDALAAEGVTLALHNHYWEFSPIAGSTIDTLAYHRLQANCPDVEFEIDTYWAANFGACDPAAEVYRVRDRTPLLHIKDGPLIKNQPMVAVGQGKMPTAEIVDSTDPNVLEWLVIELDSCATNMTEALAASYLYLQDLVERRGV